MENTETTLCKLLSQFVEAQRICPDSEVLHDLGVAGDDAWELLKKINAQFGTNFSKMPFRAYFPDETEAFGVHFEKLLGRRSSKKPLTVAHLIGVIDRGAWFDPDEL